MRDTYIHIRINRNTSIAVVVSLLIHILALYLLSRQDFFNQHPSAAEKPQPITVRLNPRTVQKLAEAAPAASIIPPSPAVQPRQVYQPKTQPPLPHPATPKVIAVPQPETVPTPAPAAQRNPAPPKPAPLDPSQFPDMASYLNAVRERRRLAGGDADSASEEESGEPGDSRSGQSQAQPQQSGTNGIFRILRMDAHTATFAFRGWKNEFSYSHREVYQVDAGMNGDIARAVVRKMIEIIRRYYSGDFNWDSQRLGRVVVLSARLQDNDGLEDFLLQDFFESRGIPTR